MRILLSQGKATIFNPLKNMFWRRRWNSWKNFTAHDQWKKQQMTKVKTCCNKWNQLHFILEIRSYGLNSMWRRTWYVFPTAKYSTANFVSYVPLVPHSRITTQNNSEHLFKQLDCFLFKRNFNNKVEKN